MEGFLNIASEFFLNLFSFDKAHPLLFTQFYFWAFFAIVFAMFCLVRNKCLLRNAFLFFVSLFFYYKTSGLFTLILIFITLYDFFAGKWMHTRKKDGSRNFVLALSVIVNLSILCYFKYAYFLTDVVNNLLGTEFRVFDVFSWAGNQITHSNRFSVDDILLPVGISFYTFQAISYIMDVYRKRIEPVRNIFDFGFYVSFFPQLVAGPIVRAKSFLPQLKKDIVLNRVEIEKGFFLIMMGLFKKSILADYLSQYNDLVFANPGAYSGVETLMAIYGYAIQIYCDFSGYTDMAIGMGKMMGFDLGINFNKPYQSTSLTDFWRRWHISLSSWLRDYLDIPLGGNRKGKFRTYLNLFITMLLGGLWHGANWKFIFWGGMHGLGLIVDKLWQKLTKGKLHDYRVARIAGWFITLHFVIFLWIFFRADSFATAWEMIAQVFSAFDLAYLPVFVKTRKLFVLLMVLAVAIHAIPSSRFDKVERAYIRTPFLVKAVAFIILVQCILQIKSSDVQPFIYFQF